MALHKTITITSGFRSVAEQAALFNGAPGNGLIRHQTVAAPGHSQHNFGMAVDAVIGGKALSSVVSSRTLKKYGLVAPVKGDPVHIQLYGAKNMGGTPPSSGSAPAPDQNAPPDQTVAQPPADYQPVGGPPTPDTTIAGVYAPGTIQANAQPQQHQDTWQLLAAQPLASPETQMLAQRYNTNG